MKNATPRTARARVVVSLTIAAIALASCSKAAELGTEQLLEAQSGGEVDLDLNGDGGFSIETEDGAMSIDEDGNFVITDENGETVTGNADAESGEFNVNSDEGDFSMSSGSGIPDEWPGEIPRPDGISEVTATVQSADDEMIIILSGTSAAGFIDTYGGVLESSGFEQTTNYEGPDNASRIFDDGTWQVTVNAIGESAPFNVSVSIFPNADG